MTGPPKEATKVADTETSDDPNEPAPSPETSGRAAVNGQPHSRGDKKPASDSNAVDNAEEVISIKRTYVFAGETITEEKMVPKHSAEARLYLQSLEGPDGSSVPKPPLRRPKKRISKFEPNPEGKIMAPTATNKGPKLNTIEKSKLDWAGFVDKEGIAEELDDASKAKEGYLGRLDFLGRVEATRDEQLKSVKKK